MRIRFCPYTYPKNRFPLFGCMEYFVNQHKQSQIVRHHRTGQFADWQQTEKLIICFVEGHIRPNNWWNFKCPQYYPHWH